MTYHTTKYQLQKDNETLIFDSEKEACEYLGVAVCTVSSCCRRNDLCKGYKVTNLGSTTHNETKTRLFKIRQRTKGYRPSARMDGDKI